MWPVGTLIAPGVQEAKVWSWCHFMLCSVTSWPATWLLRTEVIGSRSDWSCWTPLHLSPKISLWTQLYWVFLGCSQEVPSWSLWLHLWHPQGKSSESSGISWCEDNQKMGASHNAMVVRGPRRPSCMPNNSALVNTHPTTTSQKALLPSWIIRSNA